MPMTSSEIVELSKKYTLFSWSATGSVDPLPVARAEGCWMITPDGQRVLDFNSQLMSVHIGHGHPKVIAAMKAQLDQLIYVHPGATTEVRARLGMKLAGMCPGDINTFFFTLGGAEANENAFRAAKLFTGRQKIVSRYRSYHGGTNATLQLTGDPRRWANEPGMPGVIRVMDPVPYDYSFGSTEAERTRNHLRYLEEVLMYEGPHTIAAMIIEPVTGTNGVMPPPAGWLAGLKALLDRHGILLICDEVMAGFGRTGKMFSFMHGDIVPDLITMAKGLTSSYVPLGAVGVSDRIADHFRKNVFWGGLTWNAHPFALATAEAVLDVMIEEKLVERAAEMGKIQRAEMEKLAARHPCVKEFRSIGLFGMIDLQRDRNGTPLAPYNGSHPAMKELDKFFRQEGLFTIFRWGSLFANPPLVISEEELRLGFSIIDRGLDIVDRMMDDAK